MVLEDREFLRFYRISKGTGSRERGVISTKIFTRFYKPMISWNGGGWTLIFADGARMEFPESYNAPNLAQGAAMGMENGAENKLVLRRYNHRALLVIDTPATLL